MDDEYDFGLHLLDQILIKSGSSLSDFPSMPRPHRNWNQHAENSFIAEQMSYDLSREQECALEHIQALNTEQRSAFDNIIDSVDNKLGKPFFLYGAGGTGKTFVYKTICHHLRSQSRIVLCAASSGIAALLLPGGRTAHSLFKIPIDISDDSFCSIPKESMRAQLLRATDLIVWDEALMQNRQTHECLGRTMRDLCDSDLPFGGVTVIFGGDFQQILPVVPKGTPQQIINASLPKSYLWEEITILTLTKNERLESGSEEEEFAQWLLDIGHG